MRYSPGFILFAAMIRMKSLATNNYIRDERILPLLALTTVRSLIGSSNCEFRFNSLRSR